MQDRKETRVTKVNEDQLVQLDPRGTEALKVGKTLPGLENVTGPAVSVPSTDLAFVLKGTKASKAWRVVQAIRVQKVTTESVQRPVSPAMVLQVNLVCLALQDPEVCLVSWDPKDQQALRATWVIWDPLVFPDLWVTKESKGPSGIATVPTGLTGLRGRKGRRVKRGSEAQ